MLYISTNKGGLCNRIKSLVSVIKLSYENGNGNDSQITSLNYNDDYIIDNNGTYSNCDFYINDYKVYWEVLDDYNKNTHILNCSFEKLFSNRINIHQENIIKLKDHKNVVTYDSHCLYMSDEDKQISPINTFTSKCSVRFSRTHDKNIDFMFNNIPISIQKEYIKYFKILKPSEPLMSKIQEFSFKEFDTNTVSVHIRSWNRNGELGRRTYLYSLEKYHNYMIRLLNTNKLHTFYISSDSQDVINYFKKINSYSNSELYKKLIFYPRESNLDTSRDFEEGVQEDLIELYLLSRNSIMIGSHFSSFTEVAWWLGGCTKNITVL